MAKKEFVDDGFGNQVVAKTDTADGSKATDVEDFENQTFDPRNQLRETIRAKGFDPERVAMPGQILMASMAGNVYRLVIANDGRVVATETTPEDVGLERVRPA